MRTHRLVLALVVLYGCVPDRDDDEPHARHFSGAEWLLDQNGNVIATTAVLVERAADDDRARVIRIGAEAGGGEREPSEVITLPGTSRHGVLRVVERRTGRRRVVELTPVSAAEVEDRLRAH
jgi:hypothetical protein